MKSSLLSRLTVMSRRLQQNLPCVLRLVVGVASGGVGHHAGGAAAGAQGQVGRGVGIWSVGGEVGGGGEVGHAVLGLAAGVGGRLQLVGVAAAAAAANALLAGGHVVKQGTEDDSKENE